MAPVRLTQSVLTRLIMSLIIGGVVLSVGLSLLGMRRSELMLRIQLAHDTKASLKTLTQILRQMDPATPASELREILTAVGQGANIAALRLTPPTQAPEPITVGRGIEEAQAFAQNLDPSGMEPLLIRTDQPTLVRAQFAWRSQRASLEMLVDGPKARSAALVAMLEELAAQWMMMAVITLLAILLLRRWFISPVEEVIERIRAGSGAEPFYGLARRFRGEFALLAESIGGMLNRLENTTQRLRQREQAFQSLYQFAPAAMISLDPMGRIIEANLRATQMLDQPAQRQLIGQPVLELIKPEDRPLLRQAIDRLDHDPDGRCELRLVVHDLDIDVLVQVAGVREEDGTLRSVRLALQDVTAIKQLQRQLADQTRLLNLIIDHMSDAIVLVDETGHVAAHNQQLATLLRRRPDSINGQPYDAASFWEILGAHDPQRFISRLAQIEADQQGPAQERVQTRNGTFLFQGIPVVDNLGQSYGRLWVVQEITPQEQSQRLLTQQSQQLQALKSLAHTLAKVDGVQELMTRSIQLMQEAFGVEAVGIALRRDQRGNRSVQLINRGQPSEPLEPMHSVVEAVERHLMPQILARGNVTFWADMPASLPWSKPMNTLGLTSLAGVPIGGSSDAQGVLWIARKPDQRIERHHIYLLETLAPVLAAHVEIANLYERLSSADLTDPVTRLPNYQHFAHMLSKATQHEAECSLVVAKFDHFTQANQALGAHQADALLKQIAAALNAGVRRSCFVARLEAATFGVLCPGMPAATAHQLGERINEIFRQLQPQLPDGSRWPTTASVGVAHLSPEGEGDRDLLAAAHRRIEIARRLGRDRTISSDAQPQRQAG